MNEAHWRNRGWRYRPAAESAKPGYLARRFKDIIAEQKRNTVERTEKVATIQRRKA